MIVPMKKLLLLCPAADRESSLTALRELGVVHVEPVRPPEGGDVEKARQHLHYIQRALEVVKPGAGGASTGRKPEELIREIVDTTRDLKDTMDRLEELAREQQRIGPFGSFDPAAAAALRERGLDVRLFQVPPGHSIPEVPGAVVRVLSRDKQGIYLAAIGRAPLALGHPEIRYPDQSLDDMRAESSALERRRADLQDRLDAFSSDYPALLAFQKDAEDQLRFAEARAGLGEHNPVVYLRGYCPSDAVASVRDASKKNGWALFVQEPDPDDPVPTLIRNPRWVRPIKTVLDFIGVLPGYREMDISPVFLLFLSLFFAMLVGDAGYGLLFIGLTFWARRRMPRAPAYPFQLLYLMSACTVVWGAVTGTWFGAGHLPPMLDRLTVDWLKNPKNVMLLCFLIGSVHLTLAHLWVLARTWNHPRALAQIGWIGVTWTMFLMARNLVLGHPLPAWTGWLIGGSAVLIVLFMTAPRDFKNEWFNHVMLPLNLVGNFVDVVSYIRLFAVGTAGYAVASSFNKMILGGGVEGVIAGLVAALLLFLGHALNIALCVMGVLVHGVRLNTLEFSSHIGMTWSGRPYQPFRRHTRALEEGTL